MEKNRVKFDRLRFSVRLKHVVFPIELRELLDTLSKAGYSLNPKIISPLPPVRISIVGPIATKADYIVDVNSDMGVLAIEGKSEAVLTEFDELESLIKNKLNVDISEGVQFYEAFAYLTIFSEKNPIEKMGKIFESIEETIKFSDVLGEDVSVFTVKFASKGKIPNQEEWFEFSIEPAPLRPINEYHAIIVYRGTNKLKVQKFVQELRNKTLKVVELIEK